MRKAFSAVLFLFMVLIYGYLYLCIEVELKSVIERMGANLDELIDSSFRIRNLITIQLAILLIFVVFSIYLYVRKGK